MGAFSRGNSSLMKTESDVTPRQGIPPVTKSVLRSSVMKEDEGRRRFGFSGSPSPYFPYGWGVIQMLVDGGSVRNAERTPGQMAGGAACES
ncbi:hypothetical protein NQZ68_022873 [Dissostichus eleginoides]|nr:hypothetical protein NQZ68_022873 [Dissostichus eleginoides]